MRLTILSLLALLPTALLADDQIPLKERAAGWFDKAKAYIPSAIPNPIDAGASAVAAKKVERINIRNYQRMLAAKPEGEEEWMVYVTGGNKTCSGRCGRIDLLWNESVPLLSALPQQNLRLGRLDCEKEEVLCTGWAASLPSVYHFLVPHKAEGVSQKVPLHIIPLNISTTEISDITAIPTSSKSRYAEFDAYTGLLHPFDGFLAKTQMLVPLGYLLWIVGSTPSWLMMIGISFVSRQIMSRRMSNRTGFGSAAPAGDAAPAPAPAAAGPASPRGGSGKKRK